MPPRARREWSIVSTKGRINRRMGLSEVRLSFLGDGSSSGPGGKKEWWVETVTGLERESKGGMIGRRHILIPPISVPKKIPRPRSVFASQVQISFISRIDDGRSIWQLQTRGGRRLSLTDVICCGPFCHRRSVYLDVVARESCGRRNSFVPHYFFSSFLRVERARNCSLDSPVVLAMDCGTIAQCVRVTPGPLYIAGMYACSVYLSWYRRSPLSFPPPFFLSLSLSRKRDGNRKNLFALNSLLNECTMGIRFPARQRT